MMGSATEVSLLDEDPAITGALFADIRAAIGRGRDRLEPSCLLVLDIDHYRALVEDRGDESAHHALIRVAHTIVGMLPPGTPAARLGSDKFAALLNATGLRDALRLAETIRATLAGVGPRPETATDPFSVSIGVADAVGLHGETPAAALERAGEALFRAKREGRNRTKVAHPPRPILTEIRSQP
ncbi:GGDEF domain-containing protein [Magnetospirillum molischianum]|uniref:diguanylate cyclase n=1 Tax=Magnetospirillum molischianum DSM 120 TaxID=1150626 RepID=H8FSC7_MAGML|nr:GGDEF domain-containing protein [Magnetospirillum molischianum]CCG41265.1 putative Diguanylate cyclase [Magnetospirillum molischianum DSM 120]